MIIYFSGTDNSKYIATLLAKALRDDAIDAGKHIKQAEHPQFNSDTPYVFVAPTYAWRLPRVFQQWIEGCTFSGASKAYFVLTCGGDIGGASKYTRQLASTIACEYMGTAEVVMPENYLAMFPVPTEEDEQPLIAAASAYASTLVERIASATPFDTVKISLLGRLESGLVNSLFYTFAISAKAFFATDACTSCGMCVGNCMLNNITLVDGRPKWSTNCTHCMACIAKCPMEAIEYGKHTQGKRRYVCTGDKK